MPEFHINLQKEYLLSQTVVIKEEGYSGPTQAVLGKKW